MAHKPPVLLLLLCLVLMITILINQSFSDTVFIENLCNETNHHDLCVAMLLRVPRSLNCTDNPCVARAAADITRQQAYDTRDYVLNTLIQTPAGELVPALLECLTLYDTAKIYLDVVVRNMSSGSYRAAWDVVSFAEYIPGECEGKFSSRPTPVTEVNDKFEDMCDVTWELISFLITLTENLNFNGTAVVFETSKPTKG